MHAYTLRLTYVPVPVPVAAAASMYDPRHNNPIQFNSIQFSIQSNTICLYRERHTALLLLLCLFLFRACFMLVTLQRYTSPLCRGCGWGKAGSASSSCLLPILPVVVFVWYSCSCSFMLFFVFCTVGGCSSNSSRMTTKTKTMTMSGKQSAKRKR